MYKGHFTANCNKSFVVTSINIEPYSSSFKSPRRTKKEKRETEQVNSRISRKETKRLSENASPLYSNQGVGANQGDLKHDTSSGLLNVQTEHIQIQGGREINRFEECKPRNFMEGAVHVAWGKHG